MRVRLAVVNRSGRSSSRYIRRAFGIPLVRHSLTEGELIPNMADTAEVPPRESIISL